MNHLEKLIQRLTDLLHDIQDIFQRREIKDVDEWDGSASNYASTEEYGRACLINVNAAAGKEDPSEWSQAYCMLPVRGPGDGPGVYVRQAVYAAAARINQVEQPEGVSDEVWTAAVKAAAAELIRAYGEMKEDAPENLYEMAGMEKPDEGEETEGGQEIGDHDMEEQSLTGRALSFERIWEQVWALIYNEDDWAWLSGIYQSAAGQFAVIAKNGKLYRADIAIDENETVSLGEWTEVTEEFPTVATRSTLSIRRQDDGRHRWTMIACTAVLNRGGQIDSTELFDNFIKRATETGQYPYLDFFHIGDDDPDWRFGQADYLSRDGFVYLASGLFDEDHPLARAVIEKAPEDPEFWGASITFYPYGDAEQLQITDGITVPVYRDGLNVGITILPEQSAAAWFTALGTTNEEVNRMNPAIKDALKKLLGEEEAEKWAAKVDGVNRSIDDGGLIARAGETPAEPPATQVAAPEATPAPAAPVVELDDAAINGITRAVLESEPIKELFSRLENIGQSVQRVEADLTQAITQAAAARMGEHKDLMARLSALEKDEDQKRREWQEDLPAAPALRVTYRPRQTAKAEPGAEETVNYAEMASATLAEIK